MVQASVVGVSSGRGPLRAGKRGRVGAARTAAAPSEMALCVGVGGDRPAGGCYCGQRTLTSDDRVADASALGADP